VAGMSKLFYARLAAVNIRKNSKIYLPYILSSIFTVAMFYMMLYLTIGKGLLQIPHGDELKLIMTLGSIVIGIFAAVILLYTNSFLMKRRKKELGLYNILGMGKSHIARVMTFETVYVFLITLACGLFTGILLSKLILMLLLKLLTFSVPFGFEVPPLALIITVLLFAGIFFLTLLLNLGRVHLSKPIELLYGGNVGEKEPKTKRLLVLLGLLSLGAGYAIAVVTDNPINALGWFFIAVLLVILGTFCLFTAGSVALLKSLRRNKRYYYQTKHFASVSGMIYRMKQNAVGLGNICILSTMVLVMVSTTVSLYLGLEDALVTRFPKSIEVSASHVSRADSAELEAEVDRLVAGQGFSPQSAVSYRYKVFSMNQTGSAFTFAGDYLDYDGTSAAAHFIPLEDYNALHDSAETLEPGELLLYCTNTHFEGSSALLGSTAYTVKQHLSALNVVEEYTLTAPTFYFIVPDEAAIHDIYDSVTNGGEWRELSYYSGFDIGGDAGSQVALTNTLSGALKSISSEGDHDYYVTGREASRFMFLSLYGGLFFLGLFLGALFIMATVIIMYYKQMSEGYDDKKRFEIMQKVGLSRDEIKKTIGSQVLTVFFLPLIAAGIHILASFKMITRLLYLLNLTNVRLFAECALGTFAVFALIYAAVYTLTARSYYKIVS
jgi:putative ABC transport system permease protein